MPFDIANFNHRIGLIARNTDRSIPEVQEFVMCIAERLLIETDNGKPPRMLTRQEAMTLRNVSDQNHELKKLQSTFEIALIRQHMLMEKVAERMGWQFSEDELKGPGLEMPDSNELFAAGGYLGEDGVRVIPDTEPVLPLPDAIEAAEAINRELLS